MAVDHVAGLHQSLLPDQPQHHGLRTVQNWIGGSNWSPIGADFVPPAPDRVPELMADLIDYLNGAAHAPLIQAAVVHAQFETIHPFTDGNGRVGHALIHTVLARRGLTERAVLPISLVLATLRDTYIAGLNSYRHDAPAASVNASASINGWLTTFVQASPSLSNNRGRSWSRSKSSVLTGPAACRPIENPSACAQHHARIQPLRACCANCPRRL